MLTRQKKTRGFKLVQRQTTVYELVVLAFTMCIFFMPLCGCERQSGSSDLVNDKRKNRAISNYEQDILYAMGYMSSVIHGRCVSNDERKGADLMNLAAKDIPGWSQARTDEMEALLNGYVHACKGVKPGVDLNLAANPNSADLYRRIGNWSSQSANPVTTSRRDNIWMH